MLLGKIFTNFERRKLEWCLAIYTAGLGLLLILPVHSFNPDSFRHGLSLLDEQTWGAIYLVVGCSHLIALHINGRAAWTPFGRLIAVIVNSQVFLAIALGLVPANPWGTGVYTYGMLGTLFCGACIVSAAMDCGHEITIRRHRRNGIER